MSDRTARTVSGAAGTWGVACGVPILVAKSVRPFTSQGANRHKPSAVPLNELPLRWEPANPPRGQRVHRRPAWDPHLDRPRQRSQGGARRDTPSLRRASTAANR